MDTVQASSIKTSPHKRRPVAIIGMACVFPGARDLEQFWANIITGTKSFEQAPPDRIDPSFMDPKASTNPLLCSKGAFLDADVAVDAAALGLMPKAISGMEPDQAIALAVAKQAIGDANGAFEKLDSSRVGIVLGKGGYVAPSQIRALNRIRVSQQLARTLYQLFPSLKQSEIKEFIDDYSSQIAEYAADDAIGMISNMSASRVANRLNLGGPAYVVDGACASSLLALNDAIDILDQGRCDMMLVGGVHHCHDISLWDLFSKIGALSRSGSIRPFAQQSDGTLLGEGTGIIVLKPVEAAERDKDRIYAVVDGVGISSDGRSTSVVNPNSVAQQMAIRRAWEEAGIQPDKDMDLRLIEAHGTATSVGDSAEIKSMQTVFGIRQYPTQIYVGSVKALIGHTMASAGIAGLIKTCLSLYYGILPPLGYQGALRQEFTSGTFLTAEHALPWINRPGASRRRAAVSAFGFGGVNAHVVLSRKIEQETQMAENLFRVRERSRAIRLFAGSSPSELISQLEQGVRGGALDGTHSEHENAGNSRVAIYEPDEKKIALAISSLKNGLSQFVTNDVACFTKPLISEGTRIAGIFPGLEPNFAPSLDDLAPWFALDSNKSQPKNVVEHAHQIFNLERAVSSALAIVGIVPDMMVGLSFGEMVAASEAGVISSENVLYALNKLTPSLLGINDHPFALVAAPKEKVSLLIQQSGGKIYLTHDNSPEQCLVSGTKNDLVAFLKAARHEGILGNILNLKSGFHTPDMEPVAEWLEEALKKIKIGPAESTLWSSRTAGPVPNDKDSLINSIARSLVDPVDFRKTVNALWLNGVRIFIQIGSGTSCGLIRQTLVKKQHLAIPGNIPGRSGANQIQWVSNCLWAAGLVRPEEDLHERQPLSGYRDGHTATMVRLHLGTPLINLNPHSAERIHDKLTVAIATTLNAKQTEAPSSQQTDIHQSGPSVLPPHPDTKPQHRDGERHLSNVTVSLETMPFLKDHSFFHQPDDWPDDSDRCPVMPGTATLAMIERTAMKLVPNKRVVATQKLMLLRWINAAPATRIDVTSYVSNGHVSVEYGKFASAEVNLSEEYKPQHSTPFIITTDDEWQIPYPAHEYYTKHKLFHGESYQTVESIQGIGNRHIRGTLRGTSAVGSLLDGAGQMLGCWLMETQKTNNRILPYSIDLIEYFDLTPPPEESVNCAIVVREMSDEIVCADIQLLYKRKVWATITGWKSRRFHDNPLTQDNSHWPEYTMLSQAHDLSWVHFCLAGEDLPTRKYLMGNYLSSEERAEYSALSPLKRRSWLIGRIAVKDAVRNLLWERKRNPIFPSQIAVKNGGNDQPVVSGRYGFKLPETLVSIAHCDSIAVAMAAPVGGKAANLGVGIDIERICVMDETMQHLVYTPEEQDLLASVCKATEYGKERWYTVGWAAKEAAAKSVGSGLQGAPHAYHILSIDRKQKSIVIGWHGTSIPIMFTNLTNMPNEPEYVVAWTNTVS